MLATDLGDFLNKFGSQLAKAAEERLQPLFRPGVDELPDLTVLEELRTSRQPGSHPFHYFPAQHERIAGTLAALKTQRTAWLICECGCGKSPMSLAVAWLKLKHKRDYRLLIMAPGHLVRKWRREVEWLLPNVDCRIISNFADLKAFQNTARYLKHRPMVAVLGKDSAKLGVELSHPNAAGKKLRVDTWDMSCNPHKLVNTRVTMACCPTCGAILNIKEKDGSERPYPLAEYLAQDNPERCEGCGDMLVTHAVPKYVDTTRRFGVAHRDQSGYAKPHLDRYIQRHMPGVFDMLIADEVHELAASDSAQGNAFGTLASACKYVIALTGTLIGGKAHDLHAPLWRMSPALMKQRGFILRKNPNSQRSAIGRNEMSFCRKYGVMEKRVTRAIDDVGGKVSYGSRSRRKTGKSEEHPKPGISPDLFNHFLLGNAVFMSLSELGPALPTLERELVPVQPEPDLRAAYRFIDEKFKAAMKEECYRGKGPPVLATLRITTLNAYLDKPWDWQPVTAPVYQNGVKVGKKIVVCPPDLGALHEDTKDRKLVELIKREVNEGRKCAIYPQYTGIRDVRPKIVAMLQRAGIRVVPLPDEVKAVDREEWIGKNIHRMDVLIAHPKRVMTGLDLIQFPSLIWYQCGYSTHVLRQASARARRPTQKLPCKLFYCYYGQTMQEQAMSLMGEKESASQMLEGVFDCEALRAMMNGGENDDILAALANNLGKESDARKVWSKVKDEVGGGETFVFEELELKEELVFA